jgi:hypothetical protein
LDKASSHFHPWTLVYSNTFSAQNGSYHGNQLPREEGHVFWAIMKTFFIGIVLIICTVMLVSGRADRYQKKQDE